MYEPVWSWHRGSLLDTGLRHTEQMPMRTIGGIRSTLSTILPNVFDGEFLRYWGPFCLSPSATLTSTRPSCSTTKPQRQHDTRTKAGQRSETKKCCKKPCNRTAACIFSTTPKVLVPLLRKTTTTSPGLKTFKSSVWKCTPLPQILNSQFPGTCALNKSTIRCTFETLCPSQLSGICCPM